MAKSIKLKNNIYWDGSSIKDSGWKQATLTSDFSHNTNRELKYRKYGKIVTICGTVAFTSVPAWATTITNIPEGYRPRTEIDVWCRLTNNNYPCLIAINPGGNINYLQASNGSTPNANNSMWIFATYIAE